MACPLCGCDTKGPSWLGSTYYRGRQFDYVECRSCGTMYCDPMPNDETLAQMYGIGYSEAFQEDPHIDDPKEPGRTLEWLGRLGGGTFIDYGCGEGALLVQAAKLGWRPYGVEFDPEVAERVEGRTSFKIFSDPSALLNEAGSPADVLHLGDVIEHLTALDRQMPEILRLLKPGGLLLAQGPLEGNPNLFLAMMRLSRSIRKRRRYEMAPYHVFLATAVGHRTLFRRFGLEELEYSIHEVSWPAPSKISMSDLGSKRTIGLFAARRLSQLVSKLFPGKLGNRYYYAAYRTA
jgi:SAM-dependent methyltransferase